MDITRSNGNVDGVPTNAQLADLLTAAEKVQQDAKDGPLDFVAYLAEMTVLEIRREIANRAEETH